MFYTENNTFSIYIYIVLADIYDFPKKLTKKCVHVYRNMMFDFNNSWMLYKSSHILSFLLNRT